MDVDSRHRLARELLNESDESKRFRRSTRLLVVLLIVAAVIVGAIFALSGIIGWISYAIVVCVLVAVRLAVGIGRSFGHDHSHARLPSMPDDDDD